LLFFVDIKCSPHSKAVTNSRSEAAQMNVKVDESSGRGVIGSELRDVESDSSDASESLLTSHNISRDPDRQSSFIELDELIISKDVIHSSPTVAVVSSPCVDVDHSSPSDVVVNSPSGNVDHALLSVAMTCDEFKSRKRLLDEFILSSDEESSSDERHKESSRSKLCSGVDDEFTKMTNKIMLLQSGDIERSNTVSLRSTKRMKLKDAPLYDNRGKWH